MLSPWLEIERDCASAIQADAHNAKAHYLLGVALCRKREWHSGVRSLELAREMARRQAKPPSLLLEFDAAIAAGRYEWHAASCEEERRADAERQQAFETLLDERRAHDLAAAAAAATTAAAEAADVISVIDTSSGLVAPCPRCAAVAPSA
jgi:hypothetical protein